MKLKWTVAFGGNEDVDSRKRFQTSVITLRDFLYPDSTQKEHRGRKKKNVTSVENTEDVSTHRTACSKL